jgi:hypothetical protein
VDGLPDAYVGSAATEISHLTIDIGVARIGIPVEEGGGSHDLTGLAVAALGNIRFHPGNLNWMATVFGQPFDGSNFLTDNGAGWGYAGANGLSIYLHSAGTTLGDAAGVLGASQTHGVPEHPEQRCLGLDVDAVRLTVNVEFESHVQHLLFDE